MTQEDKELLLQDLSARLPHKTYVKTTKGIGYVYAINTSQLIELSVANNSEYWSEVFNIDEIKPYLRQMSSMTEEEWKELNSIGYIVPLYDGCFGVDMRAYCKNGQPQYRRFSDFSAIEDWLNKHHLDYHGLIPKGLALEAPEGMYLY